MDSENQNIELLYVVIKRFIEEETKNRETNDEDHQHLLSRLLSQLESLKEEQREVKQTETSGEIVQDEPCTDCTEENNADDIDKEEIVKELEKVERQNNITQWLLSIMIFLTVAWQISEVSIILKIRDGLSDRMRHPFKYLGGMLANMFRRPRVNADGQHGDPEGVEAFPGLKIPELHRVELPGFGTNGKKDNE